MRAIQIGKWLLIAAVGCGLAFIVAVALVLMHWHLHGKQVLGVQTGSMRPFFAPGDAVIVQPVATKGRAAYRAGDIVAYRSLHDEAVVVTHRVVAVDQRTGWLTTKGDALQIGDPTIPPRLVIGKAEAVAPHLGTLLKTARQPIVLILAVYVPALGLVASEFRRLYRHFAEEIYRYHGVRAPSLGRRRATSGKL